MYSDISLPYGAEINNRLMAAFLFVSIMCHLVFMGLLLIIPIQTRSKPEMPSVITVNMVSLPTQQDAGMKDQAVEQIPEPETPLITEENPDVKAAEPEIQPETPPEPVPVIPVPEVKPETESEQKPEVQPEQQPENAFEPQDKVVIKDAPEQKPVVQSEKPKEPETKTAPIEKPPEKPIVSKRKNPQAKKPKKIKNKVVKPSELKAESIKDAINRVRNKLAKQNPGKKGRGGNSGGISGGPVNDIYKAQIAYKIEGNWAFSRQLLKKSGDLQSLVAVKVMPNGKIEDIWFQRRSGDNYLDDSAYRAVMKSSPFPPLPGGFTKSHTFVLRFTPSGLN